MSEISTADMLSDKELPADIPEETTDDQTGDAGAEAATGDTGETDADAAKAAEADGETGETSDSTPESSDSSADEDKPWTYKAVKDERAKRQKEQERREAAEARLKELEEKIAGNRQSDQQQPQAQQEQAPNWFDDPEGAAKHQQSQMQKMLFERSAVMGQELMRSLHDDFDEMETKFFQMIDSNPQLQQGLLAAANPAKFAYETAKKAAEYDRMQNIDEYRSQLQREAEEKAEAKIRAEYEAKMLRQQAKEGAILPTLSGTSSKGGLKSDDWSGPTSLENILK